MTDLYNSAVQFCQLILLGTPFHRRNSRTAPLGNSGFWSLTLRSPIVKYDVESLDYVHNKPFMKDNDCIKHSIALNLTHCKLS